MKEPIQLKVGNDPIERQTVQTCSANGCTFNLTLKDPLLASLRTGTVLKLTLQDSSKRQVTVDVPLLGFALAFDKAKSSAGNGAFK